MTTLSYNMVTVPYVYITSGKNFIKITSVGMSAAKVMKQGRNGNVGEFRHMTTSFFFDLPHRCSQTPKSFQTRKTCK